MPQEPRSFDTGLVIPPAPAIACLAYICTGSGGNGVFLDPYLSLGTGQWPLPHKEFSILG